MNASTCLKLWETYKNEVLFLYSQSTENCTDNEFLNLVDGFVLDFDEGVFLDRFGYDLPVLQFVTFVNQELPTLVEALLWSKTADARINMQLRAVAQDDWAPSKLSALFSTAETKTYKIYRIPGPEVISRDTSYRRRKSDLPGWMHGVFEFKRFNLVQSHVFEGIRNPRQSCLISAPTGAGKTNIALLAILTHFEEGINRIHPSFQEDFDRNLVLPISNVYKVVYCAPMKALVSEIVDKFTVALKYLNLTVREFTGDINPSKQELDATHVIVTVPEKWDVLTRNSMMSSPEESLLDNCRLLIFDEIHILNEERGGVIESIVARTFLNMERSGTFVRMVGLSATMSNYEDVGAFLNCAPDHIFHFDGSYRPVPLNQYVIGVKTGPGSRHFQFNALYEHLMLELRGTRDVEEGLCPDEDEERRKQVLIFVHSRKQTETLADLIISRARELGDLDFLYGPDNYEQPGKDELVSAKLKSLYETARIGCHHAGIVRKDRNFMEEAFKMEKLGILITTATLAWGVNLPARAVFIYGTQVYSSDVGNFVDLSIMDVLQIFGRAGRPQYDVIGRGYLITDIQKSDGYVERLSNQAPIESRFKDHVENTLNAEIAMGSINNEAEAMAWLRHTYLYVRMGKNPTAYGLDKAVQECDPSLSNCREALVRDAIQRLNAARCVRVNCSSWYTATDVGFVASKYYVDFHTADTFRCNLFASMTDTSILYLLSLAKEFSSLRVREEEEAELKIIQERCPMARIKPGEQGCSRKVALLLINHILRQSCQTFSLQSDTHYIVQNMPRLLRSLFDISRTLTVNMSEISFRLLEWAKSVERQVWHDHHSLLHFTIPPPGGHSQATKTGKYLGCMDPKLVARVKKFDAESLRDMTLSELSGLCHSPQAGKAVRTYLSHLPYFKLEAQLHPITGTIVRVDVQLTPQFTWSDRWNSTMEPFFLWTENPISMEILHEETWNLSHKEWSTFRRTRQPFEISYVIGVKEGLELLEIFLVSGRWVSCYTSISCKIQLGLLPESRPKYTDLLDLTPLPSTVCHPTYFRFPFFNPVQTQIFHTAFKTPRNLVLGAPTGSGKTVVAELAFFWLFQNCPGETAVYVTPLKSLARERITDWRPRFKALHKKVVELSGEETPSAQKLFEADIVITTPEKWDGITRLWSSREYVKRVGLLVIDEIHLLGQDRGPVLEVIVSRMRYMSTSIGKRIRFVGLSTALANPLDLQSWLGIPDSYTYNFKPSIRPVPMTVHLQGFTGKAYCPRMATMNKPTFMAIKSHSTGKPTLVFVSSRRQTRLTAQALIQLSLIDDYTLFRGDVDVSHVMDPNLKEFLSAGVGIHHAGLCVDDRAYVENLFAQNQLSVLVATSTLAWGVNLPAHLVILKGAEYFNPETREYVDYPITDILQMMGRAGRPQFDTSAVSCLFVKETHRVFYRKFMYEPFPVESSLHKQLVPHINAEIASGTLTNQESCLEYMSWTFFFRRLLRNPSYYNPEFEWDPSLEYVEKRKLFGAEASRILLTLVNGALDELISTANIQEENGLFKPTILGKLSSRYYLTHHTVHAFAKYFNDRGAQPPESYYSFQKMLWLISQAPEYSQVPCRHNEDIENQKVYAQFDFQPESADLSSPHFKTYLLLNAHIFQLDLPLDDYRTDTKLVLDRVLPLTQALIDICQEYGEFYALQMVILILQCLHQGISPVQSNLDQCYGPKDKWPLERQGIDSVCQLSPSEFPFFPQIWATFESTITDRVLSIRGTLSAKGTYKPTLMSKSKSRTLYLVLADEEADELIQTRRILSNYARFDMQVDIPAGLDTSSLSLYVYCEDLLGFDRVYTLTA